MPFRQRVFLLILILQPSLSAYAMGQDQNSSPADADRLQDSSAVPDDFRGKPSITKVKNRFFPVMASLLMPGFDQWWEGQYTFAVPYTGASLLSEFYSSQQFKALSLSERENLLSSPTDGQLKLLMGGQINMITRGLSSYQAYRTAVVSQQKLGAFKFLRHHEPIKKIALAPFDFSYLRRTTTLVPLGIAASIHVLALASLSAEDSEFKRDRLTAIEGLAAPFLSYGAGVSEEAIFRGWLMPEFMELTGSPFWSNTVTASMFAVAHLGDVSVPWPQFLLGWYWGYLTQQDQWRISESVFIHSWWDVFAFLTIFQIHQKDQTAWAHRPEMKVWLPKLMWNF